MTVHTKDIVLAEHTMTYKGTKNHPFYRQKKVGTFFLGFGAGSIFPSPKTNSLAATKKPRFSGDEELRFAVSEVWEIVKIWEKFAVERKRLERTKIMNHIF